MKAGKGQRVIGRQVLDAFLVSKRQRKNPDPVKLVLSVTDSEKACEVYSPDWKKCFYSFPIAEGRCDIDSDGLVHVSYTRQGTSDEFFLRCDRGDLVAAVFTVPSEDRKKADSTGSITIVQQPEIITFACGLPADTRSTDTFRATFKDLLDAQARKRVMFLANSTDPVSPSLVNAIAIEFKMRFPKLEPENWNEAFEVLWFEFVGFCVSLWVQCLKNAIEPHTGPNSLNYFRQLAASTAGLIARGADVFQVDRSDLLAAVKKFVKTGDPSDIPAASRQIVDNVELALGNVRKRWLLQLTDLFEFTQMFSVAISIARAVGSETQELQKLSQGLVSWALSLVNNLTRGPRIIDFRTYLEKVAVSVLQMNDNRYSPKYHCVFALWKLSELVKASE